MKSSMDDGDRRNHTTAAGRRRNTAGKNSGQSHGGDPADWTAFADSFSMVQTVLDRNRELIQQANENHQSRMPDNMVKNVAIINELNGNISKVASIYSGLSENFSGHQRQKKGRDGGDNQCC